MEKYMITATTTAGNSVTASICMIVTMLAIVGVAVAILVWALKRDKKRAEKYKEEHDNR